MLSIRTFRNTDPPDMAEIWRQYFSSESKKVVPISVDILSSNILGLPFFDPEGLFIAFDNDAPVGFAHASFGPNRNRDDLDRETGVINLIMVVPSYPHREELCQTFVDLCENYLKSNGAKVIFGGSTRASASFYTGFYGGSEPLGIYDDDFLVSVYESSGYQVQSRTKRLRCDLRNYKTVFTPKSVGWGRKQVRIDYSEKAPIAQNWFQACSMAHFNWFTTSAYIPTRDTPVAELFIRVYQPWSSLNLDVKVPPKASLFGYNVDLDLRRQGLGTYVFGEAIRYLAGAIGPTMIETVAMEAEVPFIHFLTRFGWHEFGQGVIFIKILQERRRGNRSHQAKAAVSVS